MVRKGLSSSQAYAVKVKWEIGETYIAAGVRHIISHL